MGKENIILAACLSTTASFLCLLVWWVSFAIVSASVEAIAGNIGVLGKIAVGAALFYGVMTPADNWLRLWIKENVE